MTTFQKAGKASILLALFCLKNIVVYNDYIYQGKLYFMFDLNSLELYATFYSNFRCFFNDSFECLKVRHSFVISSPRCYCLISVSVGLDWCCCPFLGRLWSLLAFAWCGLLEVRVVLLVATLCELGCSRLSFSILSHPYLSRSGTSASFLSRRFWCALL